ncbi:hypothetical protein [Marinobacterium sp. xm-d-510]
MLPKQFVRLFDDKSLFQNTVILNQSVSDEILIVSNKEQYLLAVDQLSSIQHNSARLSCNRLWLY